MDTAIDEIAEGIYRISTFVPQAGLSFNQILVTGDEPFMFHTGQRALFPLVAEAVGRVMPVDQLRWIGFGHVESDECGSMNQWLAAAPDAQVAFGGLGCIVSVNDLADRAPRPLDDGETIDIGGKRLRYLATPHVPHGWEAGVFHEETTNTLLCGDLFTQIGEGSAISEDSPMEATIVAEDAFSYSSSGSYHRRHRRTPGGAGADHPRPDARAHAPRPRRRLAARARRGLRRTHPLGRRLIVRRR